jgi:CheY-like chemotaxis protein
LLVDDDDLVLMTAAAMLEDLGHTVYEAASGKEALEVFRQATAIDLVITDQGMPNMTGVQLTAAIHAEAPAVPVILATGYAELPPGAVGTFSKLSKPFRQQELARAIEAASSPKAPKR